jgi:adenine-specific DNA-methyltransferase
VVVKRFSAKEEPRRIVASVCKAKETVAFENHLNVYHRNGNGLPDRAAKGLAAFLNSSLVDMYFRLFSGHTQVNAGDLKRLNYPGLDILEKWGAVYEKIKTDPEMIDDLVEAEANKMTSKKRPGKRIIKKKLKEA